MPNFSYVWLTSYYRQVSRWFKLILAGRAGHKIMIQDPLPAPDTTGTLYKPMAEATGVVGGIKARVEMEDQMQD